MKRIITLGSFLVAAVAALAMGCQRLLKATATTETSKTSEVPSASGTPEASTSTTTTTSTMDVTPAVTP